MKCLLRILFKQMANPLVLARRDLNILRLLIYTKVGSTKIGNLFGGC